MEESDWQLAQELFEEGLSLDESQRMELMKNRCPQRPDFHEKLRDLWDNADDEDEALFDFEGMHQLTGNLSTEIQQTTAHVKNHHILETIASGDMGEVYKARQQTPDRVVALKVLPHGLTSADKHRRFSLEQKALASLSHPNVASILETGSTEGGRPYFTMEFLGPTITQYCDEKKLSIRDRLLLFVKVCAGVSFAHQNGFIHRDIKPSNVLIADHENEGIPKIIDFGIARFFNEKSMDQQTRVGAIMGTPGFMSPEQASGLPVDVRTDIYSLGSLLYQLLTGSAPLEEELDGAHSLASQFRIIMERTPPRPGSRLKHLKSNLNALAEKRQTTPDGLRIEVTRDLDRIVMKALEPEPERRYQSAAAFREDVDCYLQDLPVSVGPPGILYPLRKLMMRNKALVLMVLAFLFLLGGLQYASLASARAKQAELRSSALSALLSLTLQADVSWGHLSPENLPDINQTAELLKNDVQGLPPRDLNMILGNLSSVKGDYRSAQSFFTAALALRNQELGEHHEDTLKSKASLAFLHLSQGESATAIPLYQECRDSWSKKNGPIHYKTLLSSSNLAYALAKSGNFEKARHLFEEALEQQDVLMGVFPSILQVIKARYGALLLSLGDYVEAENIFRSTLADLQRFQGASTAPALSAANHLAIAIFRQGRFEEAGSIYNDLLLTHVKISGRKHPETLKAALNLAINLGDGGHPRAAVILLREYEQASRAQAVGLFRLDFSHNLGYYLMHAGEADRDDGDLEESARILGETLAEREQIPGQEKMALETRFILAQNLEKRGRHTDADAQFQKVWETAQQILPWEDPELTKYKNGYCHHAGR